MKTKNMSWKALFIAIIALFSVSLSKAQCPTINNTLGCTIQVRVFIYQVCNSTSPCTGQPIIVNIPAGTNMTINCPPGCVATPPCNVKVMLVQAGGSVVTPISTDSASGIPGGPTPAPTSCGGQASISYSSGVFTVY